MMTASMRLQDTLHNAVMSQRPPMMAKATKPADREKEKTVDHLIDYQVFVEQPGEEIVGVLAHDFVNEGFYTAYVPWVKEFRHVVDVFVMPAIPTDEMPEDYFHNTSTGKYPRAILEPTKTLGLDRHAGRGADEDHEEENASRLVLHQGYGRDRGRNRVRGHPL
jgi:hypothetical protein